VSVLRILIWDVAESMTSIAEIRERIAPDEDARFFWNEPQERFGVIALGDDVPNLEELCALIGKSPDLAEEYDTD
jgi:hypothetical protein